MSLRGADHLDDALFLSLMACVENMVETYQNKQLTIRELTVLNTTVFFLRLIGRGILILNDNYKSKPRATLAYRLAVLCLCT